MSSHAAKLSLAALTIIVAAPLALSAWTGPSGVAPDANVFAPLNIGSTDQVKNGGISVNALSIYGNALLSGTTNYLNFGTTAGSGGYGIRNNSGTLEYKNSGGVWESRNTLTGNLTVSGNVTAAGYFHSSDVALKLRIHTSPGLSLVKNLRGTTFDWKQDGTPSAGVIAQEVEAVMPSAVRTDPITGLKSVEYDQLIAPLIESIKEQQAEIDALRYEVETLKARC